MVRTDFGLTASTSRAAPSFERIRRKRRRMSDWMIVTGDLVCCLRRGALAYWAYEPATFVFRRERTA